MEEVELTIKDMLDGVFAISLVDKPAIQEDFVALSEQKIQLEVLDEEKRVVVGLALIPDQRIPRRHEDGSTYNIYFSADTIERTQELYMSNLHNNDVTVQHERPIKGATVIESWIVEDVKNDKSNIYNLNTVKGAWVIKMKINNNEVWNEIKEGKYKGFSIEGKYDGVQQEQRILDEIKELLKKV